MQFLDIGEAFVHGCIFWLHTKTLHLRKIHRTTNNLLSHKSHSDIIFSDFFLWKTFHDSHIIANDFLGSILKHE